MIFNQIKGDLLNLDHIFVGRFVANLNEPYQQTMCIFSIFFPIYVIRICSVSFSIFLLSHTIGFGSDGLEVNSEYWQISNRLGLECHLKTIVNNLSCSNGLTVPVKRVRNQCDYRNQLLPQNSIDIGFLLISRQFV